MKVVFLDFDGVLNSNSYIKAYIDQFKAPSQKQYYITEHIDPRAVEKVNQILDATGAKVVISSAWRKAFNLEALGRMLSAKGFRGDIIDQTPCLYTDRGLEIQAWINSAKVDVNDVVILDDNDDMLHLMHRLVKTNFELGIQDEHVQKAVEMLTDVQ